MASTTKPEAPQVRVGAVPILASSVAIVGALLVAIGLANGANWRAIGSVTAAWVLGLWGYHALFVSRERWQRDELRREIDAARLSQIEGRHRLLRSLHTQSVILDQIITVGREILDEGITDPQLALERVRSMEAHAEDAQSLIEEAQTEIRLETETDLVDLTVVDVRAEIEQVVARFPAGSIGTSGARYFAHTDGELLRILLRILLREAITRAAAEIDVALARDGASVVCTVSDDGAGTAVVPPLAERLSRTLEAGIAVSRRMGRNQVSVSMKTAAVSPQAPESPDPLDVLGNRAVTREDAAPSPRPVQRPEKIVFDEPIKRDGRQTVAARLDSGRPHSERPPSTGQESRPNAG